MLHNQGVASPGRAIFTGGDVHGSAHWMTAQEAAALQLDQPGGVVIGQKKSGERLYFHGGGHMMVFAPTRAGKGIGFVQPNLVEYQGSLVVLDPKGENAIVSAAHRRAMGQQVLILDPFGKTGMATDNYNPLGALTYADRYDLGPAIEALADALIIAPPDQKDPHWTDGGKRFLSMLMWWMVAHEPREKRNLIRMYELAHGGYELLAKIATVMSEGRAADADTARVCMALGNWFLGRERREFSYFESIATTQLGWLGDFVWSSALSGMPSPPMPLKTRKMTVYLVLPFRRMERYQRWLRLMVADCLATIYDTEGAPTLPVLFMLDEAYAGLGKMESVFKASAAAGSAGARFAFVYQDVLQVKELYGQAWESLIANSGITLFFAVNDMVAANYISQRCGQKTTAVPGRPEGMPEPLIRPEAVLGLPPDELIGLIRNASPAKFGRLNVLIDGHYKSKLAKNTTYGAPEEKTYAPRTDFVPVDLDAVKPKTGPFEEDKPPIEEYYEDRQTEALSKQFGRTVVKNGAGEYGYINARGFFIPLKD